ncbi:DUF6461 domain-containing protein [Streptomyces minutiscleroticus]|uniref:DUF6461 domain-containing protein n=1 Tax=Streptomyces minutiscleroticus TaxID=68238 RepID=UPI001E4A52E6|nr:DUF6461 domain-containing protein [Streptomyces minutiscleroticus]
MSKTVVQECRIVVADSVGGRARGWVVSVGSLSGVLGSEEFCVTAVCGLTREDVLSRLGVVHQESLPAYRMDNAVEHLGLDAWAVRLYAPSGAEWVYLFDVNGQTGVSHKRPVLKWLSEGTEAISVWSLIGSTTHVTQARDGEVVATCSTWMFEPASGSDPDRLNGALERAGFFREGGTEDDCDDALAALAAVEHEFGLEVEPGAVAGPLPTVIVPVQLL